jgi:hypothetical protein
MRHEAKSMILEVKQTEPKQWGLYVNGVLFGTSKNRFDADHGKAILENALDRIAKGLDISAIPDATEDSDDPTVQT